MSCAPDDLASRLAAILRSPLANIASTVVGASKLCPVNAITTIAQINGLASQAQIWAIQIYPKPSQQVAPNTPAVVTRGVNPWTSAVLRWTIGNNAHEAQVDVGNGQTLLLAFDTLEVSIAYFPPDDFADREPVDWGVSIATAMAGMPPALPTRTLTGLGDATVFVPKWARSVTPLNPSGAAPFNLDFLDPAGTSLGSCYGTAAGQPPPTIDLPNGTSAIQLTGGPNIRWAAVFRLSI